MRAREKRAEAVPLSIPSEVLEIWARALNPIMSKLWLHQQDVEATKREILAKSREVLLEIPPFLWHGRCNLETLLACLGSVAVQTMERVWNHNLPANKGAAEILESTTEKCLGA